MMLKMQKMTWVLMTMLMAVKELPRTVVVVPATASSSSS